MQFSVAELPLALFTTLAPLGAGAFISLACAFFTTTFSDEQLKKIDHASIIPLAVVIIGFVCAFFHLANPLNAAGVFMGAGSPLSNEVIVGCVFTVIAIVYVALACAGKLSVGARKGLAAVVAVLAVLFALFTGLAYTIRTIASWNTPLVAVQMLGLCLAGGAAMGMLVLAVAGAQSGASKGSFRVAIAALAVAGTALAIVGLAGQLALVSGIETAVASGSALVSGALAPTVLGLLLIAASAACTVFAGRKQATAGVAVALAVIGIFLCRMAFYAVQLSVGIYFG